MQTLTFKLPREPDLALHAASKRLQTSRSELVRRAVLSCLGHGASERDAASGPSALDAAGDLAGCFAGGPPDPASNPRHLDGIGSR